MNFLLHKNKPRRTGLRRTFKIVVIFLILIALFHYLAPRFFAGPLERITPLFFSFRDTLYDFFAIPLDVLRTKRGLISENEALEARVFQLETQLLSLEVETLRKESRGAGEDSRIAPDSAIVRVLAKPPQSPYDILILGGGTNDGILRETLVFAGGSVIGIISEVGPTVSRAELFSRPGVTTNAELLRTGLSFPLRGKGSGNFDVSVPVSTDVVPGDLFVLPHASDSVLAKVDSIEHRETDSFKTLFLSAPTPLFSIQWAEVLR